MAKTHFAGQLWPIRFDGRDVKALCGKIIPNARLVMVWDEIPMGERLGDLNSLATCKACVETLPHTEVIYLYSCTEKPAPTPSDEDKTK